MKQPILPDQALNMSLEPTTDTCTDSASTELLVPSLTDVTAQAHHLLADLALNIIPNTSTPTIQPTLTEQLTPSPTSTTLLIIFIVIELLLMSVICFGNILVIGAVWRAKHLQNFANYFILQLSIADLSVGLCLPFHIAVFVDESLLQNTYVCATRYATAVATLIASILCLAFMTFDR